MFSKQINQLLTLSSSVFEKLGLNETNAKIIFALHDDNFKLSISSTQ